MFHDRSLPFQIIGGKGGGGGKKGGGGGASNTPNTIRSKARAQLVELICEGPIKGLVDGDKSIYFDETAVRNANGTLNFKNVAWQFNRGLPDDKFFNGNNGATTPHSVETVVKKNIGPVVRTINDDNVDDVRIVVRINSLYAVDTKKGGLKPTTLQYRILYRTYNGPWVVAETVTISNQKTSSAYQRQHVIPLSTLTGGVGGPYDIAVERITADSDSDNLQNEFYFESYYTIVRGKFTYPNTAALFVEVNAEDMGSSIPARAVEVEGMIIKVPSNYDPETRTYSGLWNGSFKYAYSNNPAWVFYDLITNDRYGLGEFVDETKVDKWSLYQIAQYCDEMVDTGFRLANGTMTQEPRFVFNGVINSREEAFNVLKQIATNWRGMTFWSLGQVFAVADMPGDPQKIVTPANVLRGEFDYSGVALKAMHSVALVSWNDPQDFYRPAVEVVINEAMLKRYGWREKSVTLMGCTSRGQAHRYGKWILDTEQHETETVSYSASLDHIDVLPGQIIAIANPSKAQVRLGGRLRDCEADKAVFDFPFTPAAGETYTLMMVCPDGSLASKSILSFEDPDGTGGFGAARFSALADNIPQPGAMWVIVGSDVAPMTYRVLSIREEKPNEFKVTALFHDPTKFARVEQGLQLDPISYTRPSNTIAAPSNLRLDERQYVENGTLKKNALLSWSNGSDFQVKNYVVKMDHPEKGDGILVGNTQSLSMDIPDLPAGDYLFYVIAQGYSGLESDPVTVAYTVADATTIARPTVSGLENADEPGSSSFRSSDIRIRWQNNFASASFPLATGATPAPGASPFYSHNIVTVRDAATNAVLRSAIVNGNSFTYSYAMNVADNVAQNRGPSRSVRFSVSVADIYERVSDPVELTLTNPAPGAVNLSVRAVGSVIFANWNSPPDDDTAGYVLHASKTAGFTPDPATVIYRGTGNSASTTLDADSIYYFRVAAFDKFGESALTYSSEFSVSTGAFVDTDAPETPTGLAINSVIRTDGNTTEYTVLTLSWNANSESDLAYYDLQIKQGAGNYVSFQTSTNSFEIRAQGGASYTARIRAVDAFGNGSVYSAVTPAHVAAIGANPGDNAAAAINAGTTLIDPGKILISGMTSLADWRSGGDQTKIDGGNLAANTIKANAVEIGMRNISLDGIEFEHNKPDPNKVAWTTGTITYVTDAGTTDSVAVNAGDAAWTSGILFIYWTKGATSLQATTAAATAFGANNVVLASYRGGIDLNSMYGRTVIDGGTIKTGSIQAAQIAANSISADKMLVSDLAAISANIGVITSGLLQSPDGKMQVDLNNRRILIQD